MAADAYESEGMPQKRRFVGKLPTVPIRAEQWPAATARSAVTPRPSIGLHVNRASVRWLSTAHGDCQADARRFWYTHADDPLQVPNGVIFSAVQVPAEHGRIMLGLLEGSGVFGPVARDTDPRVDTWTFLAPPSATSIVDLAGDRRPPIDWSDVEQRCRPVALDSGAALWLPAIARTSPARHQWVRPPNGPAPRLWIPYKLAQALHSAYTPPSIDAAGAPAYGTTTPVRILAR